MLYQVAVVVGSLRRDSLSRKLAYALKDLAPSSMNLELLEIGDLPLYNQDFDANPPSAWTDFRHRLQHDQAVLFITPEYNRSIPAVLKNAIDVGSRPYGQSSWNQKPAAIISLSMGALGGFGANHHLRQSLVFLNMPTMQQPEAYIGNASDLFDQDGKIKNPSTKEFMQKFMNAFHDWIKNRA